MHELQQQPPGMYISSNSTLTRLSQRIHHPNVAWRRGHPTICQTSLEASAKKKQMAHIHLNQMTVQVAHKKDVTKIHIINDKTQSERCFKDEYSGRSHKKTRSVLLLLST